MYMYVCVCAVEASNVAKCAELLVKANNLEGRIVILNEMGACVRSWGP
jgi:hypothetical protein